MLDGQAVTTLRHASRLGKILTALLRRLYLLIETLKAVGGADAPPVRLREG